MKRWECQYAGGGESFHTAAILRKFLFDFKFDFKFLKPVEFCVITLWNYIVISNIQNLLPSKSTGHTDIWGFVDYLEFGELIFSDTWYNAIQIANER